MNRQLVAFLSLFSLVLVLSVYYVLIPTVSASTDENENSKPVNGIVLNAEEAYFETLSINRDAQYQEYYEKQNNILASSEYSNLEKEQALITIEAFKEKERELENMEYSIKCIGYSNVFVEYIDQDIYVITSCQNEENKVYEAAQIIFTIQDLLEKEENIFVEFHSL